MEPQLAHRELAHHAAAEGVGRRALAKALDRHEHLLATVGEWGGGALGLGLQDGHAKRWLRGAAETAHARRRKVFGNAFCLTNVRSRIVQKKCAAVTPRPVTENELQCATGRRLRRCGGAAL